MPVLRARVSTLLESTLLVLPVLGLLAWHTSKYWPFLSDDAMISFVYARRLADGFGLTWSDGQRVEGYTDLLWVLILSVVRLARRNMIDAARILGGIGAVSAIVLVSLSARTTRLAPLRLASGGLFLALCAPLAIWVAGALEHAFMAGVLAACFVAIRSLLASDAATPHVRIIAAGLLTCLVLLRADGAVLVAAIAFGVLAADRLSWNNLHRFLLLLSAPVLAWCTQLVFRVVYYGKWVPHTAAVKVSFNWQRVEAGQDYVSRGLAPVMPVIALAMLGILVCLKCVPRHRWLVPMSVLVLWSAYVLSVGGDIFPGWRQLLFAHVALAFIVAESAEALTIRVRQRGWLVPALCLPAFVAAYHFQDKDSENRRAITERWEWDGYSIGHVMKVAFGQSQPLLAVDAAGALPHWSGLPTVDMLGLNDLYIAAHPPATFGRGGIGHELGDGAYVLRRKPDIVAFNNAAGSWNPSFLSGRQMLMSPEFAQLYQRVRVVGQRGNRATGDWWLRREDGVLGVRRQQNRIDIPGYLFATGNVTATLAGQQLVIHVTEDVLADIPALRVPAGGWRLEIYPSSAKLHVGYKCDGIGAIPTGTTNTVLELERPRKMDIIISAIGIGRVELHGAALVRTEDLPTRKCRVAGEIADVPLAALGTVKRENQLWDHPTNVLFDHGGLLVRLPVVARAAWLDLSVDNNDTYVVRFLLNGNEVGLARIDPRANGGGLAQHRVPAPESARERGYNALEIRGDRGDGRYSVGHLLLLEM